MLNYVNVLQSFIQGSYFLKVNFTFRLIAEFVTLNLANQSISETDIMKIEN